MLLVGVMPTGELEKEEPLIHVQHELLGKLLYDHLVSFIKPTSLEVAESYKHLVEVSFKKEKNHLPRNEASPGRHEGE